MDQKGITFDHDFYVVVSKQCMYVILWDQVGGESKIRSKLILPNAHPSYKNTLTFGVPHSQCPKIIEIEEKHF